MTKLLNFDPSFLDEIQAIRRDIHAHPEVAYEETRTADLIAAKLEENGITVFRGMGKTGVVGKIQNGPGNRSIGLRADIDALPMQELNQFKHASRYPGKMHACGHDGHAAMLLGAAIHLAKTRNFNGTVYTIFQPAEESYGGAPRMIKDGLFDKYPMDAIFGMHNWPDYAAGKFAVRPGPMMASSNSFKLTVHGLGGHGGQPHHTADPIVTVVQIAQAWQTIISRNKAPVDMAALSITQIHAGSAFNIIPDEAIMVGTVRTFQTNVLDMIETRMREIAQNVAAAFNCTITFDFLRSYPPLVNHARETAFAIEVMESLVGKENVISDAAPTMTAEDFSFMLDQKPGCYVFIGNGSGEHREPLHGTGPCLLHNPSFDFNDEILPLGINYWVRLTEKFLG
jgi:hippurate hydrolase